MRLHACSKGTGAREGVGVVGGVEKVKLQEMLPVVTYETNDRGTESCSSAYQLTKDRVMLPN